MDAFIKIVSGIVTIVAMVVILGLVMSWPVMLLWNGCLVGAVSGISEIGWLQAWGILVLCGMLFKTSVTKSE
jgi:hypothetical protein